MRSRRLKRRRRNKQKQQLVCWVIRNQSWQKMAIALYVRIRAALLRTSSMKRTKRQLANIILEILFSVILRSLGLAVKQSLLMIGTISWKSQHVLWVLTKRSTSDRKAYLIKMFWKFELNYAIGQSISFISSIAFCWSEIVCDCAFDAFTARCVPLSERLANLSLQGLIVPKHVGFY